ncbi:MAG: LamG domain-containing protein, partial [Candidatus Nanohaloarchaea archaeon]|nr:LamG domain-containing protein [Candidatus Nanohaloarchaea archaeon]
GSIETSLHEAAAAPESSRFAFSRLALQTGDNVIVNGSMLPKGGAGNGFSVEEAGPVFVDVRFDADHIYRFFAFNQFIRWQGPHTLSTGEMPLNGTAYTVFDVWEAGNDTNTKEITPGGTFSGGLSQDSFPYVAMYNNTTGTSMMLLTNTTEVSPSINRFDASNQSGIARMGLSSQTGSVTVSHLDIWIGDGRAPMFVADRHANPPRLLLEQEQRGSFNPSGGWRERVRVAVEERNGSYLVNYPVNVSVNLGRLGAFDDCRNIVVVEGDVIRNYTLRERCDSASFREPQGFTARWPFDEGFGSFANATVSSFVTRFEGSPTWVPGEHRFALSFDPEDNLDFSGPSINLRNSSFTITLWFRANVHAQDYTEQVNFLKYSFDTPSFGLGTYSGEYFLQARYYNETENMTLLNGTPLSNDRVWRHAAMVYNETSENLSLYMNGRLQTFTTAPGLLNLSSNDFTIAEGYSGAIDELKIYKVALTRRELAMQYDERTTLTFLTNVSAASTETDVAIYGNGTAGLTGDELQSIDASLQPGDEPVGSVVSDPVTYARAIQTVRHHLQQVAGLGPSLTVERQAGCVRFRFETSRLQLRDTIC